MPANTQPPTIPTGVDFIFFLCPDCGVVLQVVTGLVYGGRPITTSTSAGAPCGACRAKGH